MNNFFRKEVYETQQKKWLGPVRLAAPLGVWPFAIMATMLVLGGISIFIWGKHTKILHASGQIISNQGVAALRASGEGTIKKIYVKDGSLVEKGAALIEVDKEKNSAEYGKTSEAIKSSQYEKMDQLVSDARNIDRSCAEQANKLQTKIAILSTQSDRIASERGMMADQVKIDENMLSRFESISGEGYVSQLQVAEQRSQLIRSRTDITDLDVRASQLRESLLDARSDLRQLPIKCETLLGENDQKIQELKQQMYETAFDQAVILRAPRAGTIANLTAKVGEPLVDAEHLADIEPADLSLEVELWLPRGGIGFVRKGQMVELHFDAYPEQHYGKQWGTVQDISRTPLAPNDFQKLTGLHVDTMMYRILVSLTSDKKTASLNLAPGETVAGNIVIGEESIFGLIRPDSLSNTAHL